MRKTFRNFGIKNFLLLAIIAAGVTSCSEDDSAPAGEDTARLTVRLTDAPGDYEAVNVEVTDVMIQTGSEEADENGWMSLDNVQTGTYDLLELTGGVSQLLADTEVPAGYVGQIRLVLGNDNSVVIDGETEPLSTPSAQQSGLKLQIDQEFEAGESYAYILDFDVEESIVVTGNGGRILQPVIRVAAEAGAGKITGAVHPTDVPTLVKASNASHTISAYTNANGDFVLHGVPAGTYQVSLTPSSESDLAEIVENNVQVEANGTTSLETVFFE